MDYSKLASVINGAVKEQVNMAAPHIRLGTVENASDTTASIVVDGSENPTIMARCCACAAGDRVVILRQGTQFYCIAKVGG